MDHKEKHLRSGDTTTGIVIGLSDGLIIPFALVAGLSGAGTSASFIVIAGIITIAAGAIVMGLGGYLAARAEIDQYRSGLKRKHNELKKEPDAEKESVRIFFDNIGLTQELQEQAAEEASQDKKQWTAFLERFDLVEQKKPGGSAFIIGLSFAAGGFVPLISYFFIDTPIDAFKLSALLTLLSLFIFGFIKNRINGMNAWRGAARMTLTGAAAAFAAFGVAKLFVA